mmetsp:Transcript_4528/g.11244  ORF Transcript_4528/g.11244 Transcript_4528/m.11244 type:complete len:237 (+) Transcript_4528:557-1267(+)
MCIRGDVHQDLDHKGGADAARAARPVLRRALVPHLRGLGTAPRLEVSAAARVHLRPGVCALPHGLRGRGGVHGPAQGPGLAIERHGLQLHHRGIDALHRQRLHLEHGQEAAACRGRAGGGPGHGATAGAPSHGGSCSRDDRKPRAPQEPVVPDGVDRRRQGPRVNLRDVLSHLCFSDDVFRRHAHDGVTVVLAGACSKIGPNRCSRVSSLSPAFGLKLFLWLRPVPDCRFLRIPNN